MLEKFVENIMAFNQPRLIKHTNSMENRSRDQPHDSLPAMLMRKAKSSQWELPRLIVSMWETESTLEMFDYENKGVRTKQFKLDDDHDVYISGIDKKYARCILTKSTMPNDNTYCGSIERAKGQFYYIPGTQLQSYQVIGSDKNNECKLKAGDLIRIGRMRYFVKQVYDGFESKSKEFSRDENSKELNLKSLKSGSCKFCLCDEKDNLDLLISPCSCKGSCAQVHVNCLKQWLANKVSRKSNSCVEFLNYDNFSCQICKDDLPTVIKVDGETFNMLRQETTSKDPYIVLEGIPNDKSSTKNNLTIKINFKDKSSLVIGRSHEADIRLEDVSISRQHCILFFFNRTFSIIDNESKFGTLVKIQPGQRLNIVNNKIQIGRMTLQMSTKTNVNEIYSKYKKENINKR